MDPVDRILGDRDINCFNCGRLSKRSQMHYWHHGDQDDLVCKNCARRLKHTDTIERGMYVLR